jgi:chemotaxis protein histidine kinase CheA
MMPNQSLSDQLVELADTIVSTGLDGKLDAIHQFTTIALATGFEPAARVLRRIGNLVEVAALLDPDAARQAAEDAGTALGQIAEFLRGLPLDQTVVVADALLSERWGSYLELLDSTPTDHVSTDMTLEEVELPPPPDEEPNLDIASLLRLITGGAVEEREPVVASDPAHATRELIPTSPPEMEAPKPEIGIGQELATAQSEMEKLIVDLDPEIRECFLADAADMLGRIETASLLLSDRGKEEEAKRELARSLHTLKGAAGAVGLSPVTDLCHSMEDLVTEPHGDRRAFEKAVRDGLNKLERLVAIVRAPAESKDSPVVATEARPTFSADGSGDADATLRISPARLDALMDLAAELITRRGRWAAHSEAMRAFAISTRSSRSRLSETLDLLGEQGIDEDARRHHLAKLSEQVEDVVALAEEARVASSPLADDTEIVSRVALRLWESIQSLRLVSVGGLFRRLSRVMSQAAQEENKEVEVEIRGDETTLDRGLQERLFEPLLHLVRNAVGHGIEAPDQRRAAGKSVAGRIVLEASRHDEVVVLSVTDDGRGLDSEAIRKKAIRLGLLAPGDSSTPDELAKLIFHPGFSTRETAGSVAGRGVGMDVVAKEIANLKGTINLASQPGRGMCLTLHLPSQLWLERAIVCRMAGQPYSLPLAAVEEIRNLDRYEPRPELMDARTSMGLPGMVGMPAVSLRVRANGKLVEMVVDAVDGPRELVPRPLPRMLEGHPAISGTSLLATGELVFALDTCWVSSLRSSPVSPISAVPSLRRFRALVVDDSISVRRSASRQLKNMGLDVDEASDGVEALGKLRSGNYALLLTDLEMPRMDGFELLRQVRHEGNHMATPVIVSSSRSDATTREQVHSLGASAFVAKPASLEEFAAVVAPLLSRGVSSAVG